MPSKSVETQALSAIGPASDLPAPIAKPIRTKTRQNANPGKTPKLAPDSSRNVPQTKAAIVLKKLHNSKGATLEQLMLATGWQAHSVRGFLSGMIRKKQQLNLTSEVAKDGVRRYMIANMSAAD